MTNENLKNAKSTKNDEFYTLFSDVEQELCHYMSYFQNKIVFCNCDDPDKSAFYKYFHENFSLLKLKKLISLHLSQNPFKTVYGGGNDSNIKCRENIPVENGDFRGENSISILKESDIVVTNPPFSLFRDFVDTLMLHEKKFIVIGNKNSVNINSFFRYLKSGQVHLGFTRPSEFLTEDGKTKRIQGLCRWYTNLPIEKEKQFLNLSRKFDSSKYPKYENYDAINVDKVSDIPFDYYGVMGVPITFLDHYNPDQFEILGRSGDTDWAFHECDFFTPPSEEKQRKYKSYYKNWRVQNSYLLDENGMPRCIYYRVFVRRKQNSCK